MGGWKAEKTGGKVESDWGSEQAECKSDELVQTVQSGEA